MSRPTCPKCGAERVAGMECPSCRVIYAKAEARTRAAQYQVVPPHRQQPKKWAFPLLVVLLAVLSVLTVASQRNTPPPRPLTAAELDAMERSARIRAAFSPHSGAHRGLEATIKSSMGNPSSYEHVETRYSDQGEYLLVRTTFRGANAFGGIVSNTWIAHVSVDDGTVLAIVSTGPD